MESPFVYDKYVTGKNYVGRKKECATLANMLSAGENIVIYSPPKTGKMSAIQQTLFNMKMNGEQYSVCTVNLFNVRTVEDLLLKWGSAVIRSVATTPDEYQTIIKKHLANTHFVFDRARYADCDEVVSMNWEADPGDIFFMLRLPGRIASSKGEKMFMVVQEFQTVAELDGSEKVLRAFKEVFGERRLDGSGCSYIITGSRYNAMDALFRNSPLFKGIVERFIIPDAEEQEITDYIVRGMLVTGKVIEKDAAMGIAGMFDRNLWYISHFMSICDSMTKGYITNAVMMDALRVLVSVHAPRFEGMICNLTWYQISFLQAVIDGITHFTSTAVVRKYGLNSSANVLRVREALMKKEILTFNESDEPVILDPLFRYWLEKTYFAK